MKDCCSGTPTTMQFKKIFLLIPFAAMASLGMVKADDNSSKAGSQFIVTTTEGAGSFNTTLSGVSVENFSGYNAGVYNNVNWSGVGSINQVSLINNNQYGGTPTSTIYPVQSESGLGGQSPVESTTISLKNPVSYFGLYWSAGDSGNHLDFYNGNTLVGSFLTSTLMNNLPSSYNGNPNSAQKGQDAGEKFGFINFFANPDTTFNKIVLSNPSSSGFESQDWTVRVGAYDPKNDGVIPGTPVAEFTTSKTGVTTTTKITDVAFNGSAVTYKDSTGKAVNFETVSQPSGSGWTSYGFSSNGHSLGVIRNPEPSAYLTFAMLGTLVILVAKRRQLDF